MFPSVCAELEQARGLFMWLLQPGGGGTGARDEYGL